MIVYCVQTFHGEDWTNQWAALRRDADRAYDEADRAEQSAHLLEVVVEGGRQGLVDLLNLACANHMNLPGRKLRGTNHQPKPKGNP